MKSVGPLISPGVPVVDRPGHRDAVQRGEPAGERLGGGGVALVGLGADRLLAQPQGLDARRARRRRAPPCSCSRSRVASSSSSQRVGRSSTVTPCSPSGGTTWLPGGSSTPSMTSRMCGVAGALVGAEARPVAEVGRQQRGEVVERRRDHPHRADRVGLLLALGVRQPLDPVPVGQVLARRPARRRRGGRGSGRRSPSRSWRGPARAPAPPRRRPRSGRRPAGRSRRAGRAGCGARRAAGAAPTRRPGRPGRSARSRAAPARGRAAGSTARSGPGGSAASVGWCSQTRVRSSASAGQGRGVGVVPGQRPALLGRRPRGRPCGRWRGSAGTRCASR